MFELPLHKIYYFLCLTYVLLLNVILGNVTLIVMTAISTLLDCYFEVRRSPMTHDIIRGVRMKIDLMVTHFIALNQCMKRMTDKDVTLPNSRKLHAVVCNLIPFLIYFGTMLKADTSSYESVHRSLTVAMWELTSKKKSTMYEEMAKQSINFTYTSTSDFLEAFDKGTLEQHFEKHGPYKAPEDTTIIHLNNLSSWTLSYNQETLLFEGVKNQDLQILLLPTTTTVAEFTANMRQFSKRICGQIFVLINSK